VRPVNRLLAVLCVSVCCYAACVCGAEWSVSLHIAPARVYVTDSDFVEVDANVTIDCSIVVIHGKVHCSLVDACSLR